MKIFTNMKITWVIFFIFYVVLILIIYLIVKISFYTLLNWFYYNSSLFDYATFRSKALYFYMYHEKLILILFM